MPSWVVPAVAAELWAVPVEQVMADVAAGRIPSRTEGGLLFVDIDPATRDQPHAEPPPAPYRRSLAWAMGGATSQPIVTAEERNALLNEQATFAEADDDDDTDVPAGDAPAPIALTSDDMPNWDEVRARVSQTRRGPAMREAA